MLRRLHVHPLLFGAAPVLLLWAGNAAEVSPSAALPVLAWVLLGVAALLGVTLLWLRDLARAALATSAVALLVLNHGNLLGDLLPRTLALAALLAVLAVAILLVVRTDEATLRTGTALANVVGLVLVLVTLPGVASSARVGATVPPPEIAAIVDQVDTEPTRDIFYIVPDRYGRQDQLAATFGIDNSTFTGFLEEHGFEVVDDAIGNYPTTAHSLASTLGMTYLDGLTASVPEEARGSWRPVYDMLRDHRLGRVLTAVGYEYIHVGTWWSPTSSAVTADDVRNYEAGSEFAAVFSRTTAVPAIIALFGPNEELTHRERARAHSAWQLDELERLVGEVGEPGDRPRFVFLHITLPHEPYVFDADGRVVTEEQEDARTRADNYGRQVRYLNSRLRSIVEQLTGHPEETAPIVVLQADEGPHPARVEELGARRHAWGEASDAELRTKLRILSAYHLPGVDVPALVREDMTPVNTFRLLLDAYLGTELGQLEDRAAIFAEPDDMYTFTDVTDRVRSGGP